MQDEIPTLRLLEAKRQGDTVTLMVEGDTGAHVCEFGVKGRTAHPHQFLRWGHAEPYDGVVCFIYRDSEGQVRYINLETDKPELIINLSDNRQEGSQA